jgi:phenylacetate-CoA ligase
MFEKGIPTWASKIIGNKIIGQKNNFSKIVNQSFNQRKKDEFLSAERKKDFQLKKLISLLTHANENCPYYTNIFKKLNFNPRDIKSTDDIKKLPILSKTDLIKNRDQMISKSHRLSDLNLNSSGGSTGVTVNFYQDQNWLIHQVSGARFFDSIAGFQSGCRVGYLWGAPSDNEGNTHWKAKLKSVLTNVRLYDSFNMSEERMAQYHQELLKFKPDILVCYAGSIHLFSKFILKNKLKSQYPIKGIITSAETLTDDMRKTIESALNRPVFNRYGSREVGLIAAECEHHSGLHINESDMIVETDSSEGESGDFLVTNLNNFGMPLIRYQIGDVGEISNTPCTCGRSGSLITKLLGRSSDFFTTTDGRKIHGEYFTHLFYGIDGVEQFQLTQETLDFFELKIIKNLTHWHDEQELKLRNEITNIFGVSIKLNIHFVSSIASTASGKYRFTISKV